MSSDISSATTIAAPHHTCGHSLPNPSPVRSHLRVYNTCERLLRGDFFHSTTPESLTAELADLPPSWPIVGLGTSNWYRQNGELIIAGTTTEPQYLWGDPRSTPEPGRLVDLATSLPPAMGDLVVPPADQRSNEPSFPFATVAVCPPEERLAWTAPDGTELHPWLQARLAEANIGLAAIQIDVGLANADYSTMCHIPLDGLDLTDGYVGDDTFRFGSLQGRRWDLRGIYAANETVQAMVSVAGHPLHLHGFSPEAGLGGHLNLAVAARRTDVSIWPLKDLEVRIREMDVAAMPVRNLDPAAANSQEMTP